MGISFTTDNAALSRTFEAALQGLRGNLVRVYGYEQAILREGAEYNGIWLECGPHEGTVYGVIEPEVALHNHRIFFRHQREDGYLPCWIWPRQVGTGQIQMVVPIAATAYEVYEQTGDEHFLEEAYAACAKWDDWLRRYRDTRGTGLCEAFCEFDTGHDNSPRWAGLPHECPNADARVCPDAGALPYLAPDLSATVYGGRVALAKMARHLNRDSEAVLWEERAEQIRRALLAYCFDPEDLCFYDLDRNGRFVRIRGDALTRVLGEHVVDQSLFEAIYARHIHNADAFWTPYPLPSIAANDPAFVRTLPPNSWGGASQALTALRAPRWFGHYGKHADLCVMMEQWVKALSQAPAFLQQLNPWTGKFTPSSTGYSPAMLVLIDYVTRLHGVRREGQHLEWSCQLPTEATTSTFTLETSRGTATLAQGSEGATLTLGETHIAQVQGPCRVVTDLAGNVQALIGLRQQAVDVQVVDRDGVRREFTLRTDERCQL